LHDSALDLPAWCDLEVPGGYNASNATDVVAWLERVNAALAQAEEKQTVQLRYYWVVPSAAVFIADDSVFVSPFIASTSNVKLPMLEFSGSKRPGKLWIDRFVRIWESPDLSRPASNAEEQTV
jgi:hypothetical protein